jgi:hypothetical protein
MDRSSELFQALIIQLAQSGWASLGKVPNPITGEIERNMEIARLSIDTLEAVEVRTRGNLSEEESKMIERLLRELRMNYLDEVKRDKQGSAAESETEEPEGKDKIESEATEGGAKTEKEETSG